MKNLLLSVIIILSVFSTYAQTPDWQWIKGATGSDFSAGVNAATDAAGNVYVLGSFTSNSIVFGTTTLTNDTTNASVDLFLLKYDSAGNVVWAKSAGGTGDDNPYAITSDASGNIFITGSYTSVSLAFGSATLTNPGRTENLFVAKYDAAGNVKWAKSAISGDDAIFSNAIAIDAAGSVYVTGYFGGNTATFGTTVLTNASLLGGSNIFLAKYDNAGNLKWAKSAGGDTRDYGLGLTTTTGSVYLTGSFSSTFIAFDKDTLYNAIGSALYLYLVKYDTTGNVKWAKSAESDIDIFSQAVSSDASGNVYVGGSFYSSFTVGTTTLVNNGVRDMFLIKYDKDGNAIWAKNSNSNWHTYDVGSAIATDASGNTYVTGYFSSDTLVFGSTILVNLNLINSGSLFIVKYDANGNMQWAQGADGSGNGICTDASGNVYLVGDFSDNSISLGTLTLNNTGGFDNTFVAKYGIGSTGVKTISNTDVALTIYPNPSNGKFMVQLNNLKAPTTIEVYNTLGENVYENDSPGSQLLTIDLSKLPSGLYFVQLKSGESVSTQKVIVSK